MKKFLFLLPISLFADIYSDLATSYENEDYKKSYELASTICKSSCDDVNLNIILGKSAFKLGMYDEALAAYDRILVFDDDNIDARLQSAIIYQKNGNYELLKMELETLKNDERLKESDRELVAQMLESVKQQEKAQASKNGFYGNVGLGYGYDSNPKRQNPADTYIKISASGIINNFPIPGEAADPASSAIASAKIGYKDSVNDFYSYDIGLNLYNKYYIKNKNEDFQNLSVFTASINNGLDISKQFKMNVLLSYDYIILKQKRYLNTFSADISGDVYFNNGAVFGLGYTINHNSYLKAENKDNDSNHHSIYAMGRLVAERSMIFLRIARDIEKNSKINNSSNDYKEYSVSTGLIYLLNKQVMLRAIFSHAKSKYDNLFFQDERIDKSYKIMLGAEYDMDHHNIFSVDLGYDKTKSTIERNSYHNYFANLMYKYKF